MEATLNYAPGSFRDREGRVFYDEAGRVCRALSARALSEWRFVSATRFFADAMRARRIVPTAEVTELQGGRSLCAGEWAAALCHETVPFVSYPYEWTFGMLRDAATLHLELLIAALDEGVTIKDGTAYNVQWFGVQPVFIDVASFERLVPGQPWAGYRQFCQTFLFPLLLQAYKNLPFQPWLRGRLEGISPQECRDAMSARDLLRRGVLTHVVLHAWLDSLHRKGESDVRGALPRAGFRTSLIRRNAAGLLRLIRGLRWSAAETTWSNYGQADGYAHADRKTKEDFVRRAVHSRRWTRVWDVGCNTGRYARIAAENADVVVAMDTDQLAVDRLYQALKSGGGSPRILPIVTNLIDPAGGLGWRGAERQALVERGPPDLTLVLAMIHHLVIGLGVPLRELLDWFASLRTSLVIEFVSKEDPMVQRLLANRLDHDSQYEVDVFQRLLAERFSVVESVALTSHGRTLHFATPK